MKIVFENFTDIKIIDVESAPEVEKELNKNLPDLLIAERYNI